MKSRREVDVDEPGPGDLGVGCRGGEGTRGDHPLGDLARVGAHRLGEGQRPVDLHVGAVRRPDGRIGRSAVVDLGEDGLEQP